MTLQIDQQNTDTLDAITPLRAAGFALHWLKPRSKAPIGDEWSEAAVASLADLRRTHASGNNLGVRLGEPSRVGSGYLHVLDLDIRVADLADEALEKLTALFPGINLSALPCVASGSGGASRHLYFVTDKPFRSKKLATSDGKHRREKAGKTGWSYDWEIELFGTGKQVAMPPSIHPDTRRSYTWERPFDFDMLDLGMEEWPTIPSAALERLAVVENTTFAYEERDPLTFKAGQFERILGDINVSDLDYDDWIKLGQAIHHQTGGSADGFDLWLRYTRPSSKFLGERQVREMRRIKWPSFGKYRGKPVTMATIVEWAQAARVAAMADAFDDLDDEPASSSPVADAGKADIDAFDDLLGGGDADAPLGSKSDLDLLGGGDDDDAEETDLLSGSSSDWMAQLDLNLDSGAVKPTLHNVELLVRNDPRLVGLPQLNEFTQEPVQRTLPGTKPNRRRNSAKQTRQLGGRVWQVRDPLNGDLWSDDRDSAIRSILEAPKTQGGYGVKVSDRDLKAAIALAANDNAFHPVREYLEGTEWDGVARVETLFHDYVGAPDDPYTRSVSRLMLVAAVTRIYEPGHKFDHVVILEGLQGKRKSTFIRVLGRKWFGELNCAWDDSKQAIEQMSGKWILELPELSGLSKSDVRSIKAFVSTQVDRARLAYARRAGEFPRQCIYIGSTNDAEYLRDQTGGRRFWPVHCNVTEIDTDGLESVMDLVWAEAVALYREMRRIQPSGTLPLYLTEPDAQRIAAELQESRREETVVDSYVGQIEAWLDAPVQTGDLDDDIVRYRDETCLKQIWEECLGAPRVYSHAEAMTIGAAMNRIKGWSKTGHASFPKYGKQRRYERGGITGRHARAEQLAA